jgi:beta-lactamase regulating signal transducer with metallopeptidase domain
VAEALFDHLWQSTLCAVAAALLTLLLRKDGARVRFFVWFAASAKFLVPFSLLVWIGGRLSSGVPSLDHANPAFVIAMDQITRPASLLAHTLATLPVAKDFAQAHWNGWTIVLLIWLSGSFMVVCRRTFQWLYLQAIAQASTPLDIVAPIPINETASNIEPGLFGIVSPTLLVPAGIASQLGAAQLDAIIAHELCHWRRRDNLTAAIHMLVEALFWFYPLVWWLGARMAAERERACDEAVIQSGSDRHVYAEGILKVCQRYVEASQWSAGVSGGLLRRRIEEIMTSTVRTRLSPMKRCILTAAATVIMVAPLAAGLLGGADVAYADEADSVGVTRYKNTEWSFELDIPSHWLAMPPTSSNNRGPREVMRFLPNDSADRLLILSRHTYDPSSETFKTILATAQQDMAQSGFSNFVASEPTTIGAKRAISLDFERAPQNGDGTWFCRTYYILGSSGAYMLAFGVRNITAAQRDAVFKVYDRMAKSFTFADL